MKRENFDRTDLLLYVKSLEKNFTHTNICGVKICLLLSMLTSKEMMIMENIAELNKTSLSVLKGLTITKKSFLEKQKHYCGTEKPKLSNAVVRKKKSANAVIHADDVLFFV